MTKVRLLRPLQNIPQKVSAFASAALLHNRTYGSVYGGSCLLIYRISELGSVDVSPVVSKRPDRHSELPAPTS